MEDAPRIAAWLEEQDLIPDQIICSSAERTRETVELMLSAWSQQPDWSSDESLYLAPPEAIVSVIRSGFAGSRILMLVGHNPGMAYLASMLAGKGIDMPTAAVSVFRITTADWSGLDTGMPLELLTSCVPKLCRVQSLQMQSSWRSCSDILGSMLRSTIASRCRLPRWI